MPENNQEQAAGLPVQKLVITYTPGSGGVGVNGPIGNRALCYAMLELARDAIFESHLRESLELPPNDKPKSSIVLASALPEIPH